jgi:hypothetical protein
VGKRNSIESFFESRGLGAVQVGVLARALERPPAAPGACRTPYYERREPRRPGRLAAPHTASTRNSATRALAAARYERREPRRREALAAPLTASVTVSAGNCGGSERLPHPSAGNPGGPEHVVAPVRHKRRCRCRCRCRSRCRCRCPGIGIGSAPDSTLRTRDSEVATPFALPHCNISPDVSAAAPAHRAPKRARSHSPGEDAASAAPSIRPWPSVLA